MKLASEFYASTRTSSEASALCKCLERTFHRAVYRWDEANQDFAIWIHIPHALSTERTLRRLFA